MQQVKTCMMLAYICDIMTKHAPAAQDKPKLGARDALWDMKSFSTNRKRRIKGEAGERIADPMERLSLSQVQNDMVVCLVLAVSFVFRSDN